MYSFIKLEDMNLAEAMEVFCDEYEQERSLVKALPKMDEELTSLFRELLENTQKNGMGYGLIIDDRLVGYIGFFGPFDGFFGLCKGVFSPFGCNTFGGEDKGKVASLLIAKCMEELVKNQVTQFALSRFAKNEEVNHSFVMNSFGVRCSDAILRLEDYKTNEGIEEHKGDITFKELKGKEKYQVKELYEALEFHLGQAPCLFPVEFGTFERWVNRDELRVIAAFDQDEVIGYMTLDQEAEIFVTRKGNMHNIGSTCVKEEYRSKGIAKLLLDEIVRICRDENYTYLGVDYETINPTALRFWTKNFSPYTYSFIRRIDERVIERLGF